MSLREQIAAELETDDIHTIMNEALHRAEKTEAALERVRELHRPDEDGNCRGCGVDVFEEPIPWPCPTICAMEGDIDGDHS
jgi:rubrerythrin